MISAALECAQFNPISDAFVFFCVRWILISQLPSAFQTFQSFNSICFSNFTFACQHLGLFHKAAEQGWKTVLHKNLDPPWWIEDSGRFGRSFSILPGGVKSTLASPKLAQKGPLGCLLTSYCSVSQQEASYCPIFDVQSQKSALHAVLHPETVTLVTFWHFAKSSSTFKFKCSAPQIYSLNIGSNPSNLQYSSKYKMHFLPKDLRRVLLRVVEQILDTNCKEV